MSSFTPGSDRHSDVAARIPPGIKGVNVVQEKAPVDGVPEPGGLPAASSAATEGDRRMKAIRAAELTGDGGLIDIIREALLAANEDVYGDEGNVEALAALNELKGRLYERE